MIRCLLQIKTKIQNNECKITCEPMVKVLVKTWNVRHRMQQRTLIDVIIIYFLEGLQFCIFVSLSRLLTKFNPKFSASWIKNNRRLSISHSSVTMMTHWGEYFNLRQKWIKWMVTAWTITQKQLAFPFIEPFEEEFLIVVSILIYFWVFLISTTIYGKDRYSKFGVQFSRWICFI